MKRTKKLFLIVVVTFAMTCLFALWGSADYDEDYADDVFQYGNTGIYYKIVNDKVIIYDASSKITTANIPENIDGRPVTSIVSSAFDGCTSLTSVTIPDSVTSIGNSAFKDCTELASIEIPNSVTSIGSGAFSNTAWYNSQLDGDVYAGKVYYKYKGTMPSNTSITIKDGTKGIADYAFYGCSGLTSVTIPNSVTSIGSSTFEDCTSLTSVTIGKSVTNIDDSAFKGCTGLVSIEIPNSVTSIGYSAFEGCTGLVSIEIPDSVTSIGYSAFEGCTGLTSITIPNSVTSIGSSTFDGCIALTSITIPSSVTSIGSSAFENCTGLTKINWNAENVIYFSIYNDVFSNAGTAGDGIEIVFGDSVKHIPAYLFYSSSSDYKAPRIKTVTIGNSVTSIGKYAFYCCSKLTSVTMGNNVATGHIAGEWVVDRIATCSSVGSRHQSCSICGNTLRTETIDMVNHQYYDTGVKPTCTTDGFTKHTCSACGYSYTEEVAALGHTEVTDEAVPATCTKNGKTEGTHCSSCGIVMKAQSSVPSLGHKNKTTITKATTSKNGKVVTACTVCKKVSKTTVIYKASSVKLAKTSYTYNGKTQKPKVVVKTSKGKALTEGKDYTVKYPKGMKNPGTYTVTVTFKGNYRGKKTLTFTIAPKAPTLKATAAKKSAKLSWSKQTGATGYNVYMATSKNGKYKKIATVKSGKVSYTKTGLTKGKTYYFKVAAYTTSGGKTVNSAYSSVKSVKVK